MRCVVALFMLASIPALAHGQSCLGQTPYGAGIIKASAGVELLGNQQTTVWGGAGIGRPQSWFAGATAGVISGGGESSFGLAGMAGLELKKPIVDKLQLCPMVGIHHQFGSEVGFTDFIAEAAVAYPVGSQTGATRLMLVGDYQGIFERYSVVFGTADEWYGNLDLGIGALFSGRFSVVPQLRIPVRYGGGRDLSLVVRGSLNFGAK